MPDNNVNQLELLIVHNLDQDIIVTNKMICRDCGQLIEGEENVIEQIDRIIELEFITKNKGSHRYIKCIEFNDSNRLEPNSLEPNSLEPNSLESNSLEPKCNINELLEYQKGILNMILKESIDKSTIMSWYEGLTLTIKEHYNES